MSYKFAGPVSPERVAQNREHAISLGLPFTSFADRGRLAVIGGGPSLAQHLDELREFDGDRWIVPSAFAFCRDNGISGTVFNIDPQPLKDDVSGKAILATINDPSTFAKFDEVQVFDLVSNEARTNHGPSTVTAAPELAVTMGYKHVVFYGCDGSYKSQTHVSKHITHDPYALKVCVDGEVFVTFPEWLAQSEMLGTFIRMFPGIFSERSGGLLGAFARSAEYDITEVSKPLLDILEFKQAA